jgi:hypothetical protein
MMTTTLPERLYNYDSPPYSPSAGVNPVTTITTVTGKAAVSRFYLVTLDMLANWTLVVGFAAFAIGVLISLYGNNWTFVVSNLHWLMFVGPGLLVMAMFMKWVSFSYHCKLAIKAMRNARKRHS